MDYLPGINYDFAQDERFLKIGTDTCLLGAYIGDVAGKRVLDIGTNTGALLLYAHAKGASALVGIDINKDALSLAEENLKRYTQSYTLVFGSVQEYSGEAFDAIVCNPPFFDPSSTHRASQKMNDALFSDKLPPKDLAAALRRLLKDNGRAYIIYSAEGLQELCARLYDAGLRIEEMKSVFREGSETAVRVLLKLRKGRNTKTSVAREITV